MPLEQALTFLPEVRLDAEQARRAGHGSPVPGDPGVAGADVVRLTDDDGLVALAEPREQGSVLKPIVGLRG